MGYITLYLFLGIHLPYFGSTVQGLFLLLCVFKAFLKSLWNFWIVSRPSSAPTFSLVVLLLSNMLCLSLNLWSQLLLPLNFAASSAPQLAQIFDFIFFLNQGLDTLLPADVRSLNSASKRLEVRGYLSVRWDLFLAILLCLIGLAPPVFFFVLFRVSSARSLLLFFSHLITSDLLTPCCFATVFYPLVDDLSESKRSVFSL